ncbi:hypothetical protein B9P52_31850 [Achromobacter denitrificans]|uniref:phage adaptor protein n=1 Tax=Achromobacter denitrificans TaxID=32002 RepID=UPI000B4D03D7|nr:DUF6682 family protein [Achromobacter denitrificans]ASC68591.1 hypothetical protein B9P52_31850 [Achromobacter denitrificans]
MKVSEIIDRARIILQDAEAVYWEAAELPMWLSDGRLEAYRLRPDLYEVSEDFVCVEGARQQLPNGARVLFDVPRNVSATRQRAITVADAGALGRVRPSWRSQAKAQEIRHFLYDERSPGQFEVYPPARADVVIELSYAKVPEAVTESDGDRDLTEEGAYAPALVDYILYRAFLKEADTVPAFHQRAAQHLTACQSTLTSDVTAKAVTSPNEQK